MKAWSLWSATWRGGVLLALAGAASAASRPAEFLEELRARARALSTTEHAPSSSEDLPRWIAELDYDGYRRIRFRTEVALWGGEDQPFRVGFAHRGYLFHRRVPMHVLEGTDVRELVFSPHQFQYGLDPRGEVPQDLGYAGLKVLHPIESPGRWDEVASFLGATYFRILGRGQRYGASARGLAVDTASPRGEEFPEFVEMWLETPGQEAQSITLYALLDSPSVTGAYRLVLTPGERTEADVSAFLYFRRDIGKLGLAPITSMFLYGEQRLRHFTDYRPEVHDSDGLLVAGYGGGWLWRPLENPDGQHRVTRLPLADPQGFGLMQRDRAFQSYEDLEAHFERRPSYWVTPKHGWGAGTLELVEIPSTAEGNDNVILYWVPEQSPAKGEELAVHYTLAAILDEPTSPPAARVRATRVKPGETADLFLVDFEGPHLGDDQETLRAEVTGAEVQNLVLHANEPGGGLRCAFEVPRGDGEPVELRLMQNERQVSETWTFPRRKP